ncbi:MAG TPA: FmdB family zinc ribbon protein [Terriglobia bacterium]|nr:FmdB family zinc ribbon protein [Terriglobia bacterium]
MPLYEYQCKACEHRFEVIQKFSDQPVRACPRCGKDVERLLSSPAIQFKGTGWYVTDYARRSGASAADGDGKAAKDTPKESASPGPEKSEKAPLSPSTAPAT